MVRISVRAMKFDEMTVRCQPTCPSRPRISVVQKPQVMTGVSTQRSSRNIYPSMPIASTSAPMPKITISLRTKVIMSSAIIEIPPR